MTIVKKFFFIVPIICLWSVVILLTLEIWAVFLERDGLSSAQYSSDWKLRRVREAFDSILWKEPWKEYLPYSTARYSSQGHNYNVSINKYGFRGDDTTKADTSSYRIACIGGSTTVEGDTNTTTYPAYLQKFLNEGSNNNLIVDNCGVGGLGTDSYRQVMDKYFNNFKPNMVIEYNAVNDICWKIFPYWQKRLSSVQVILLKSRFISRYLGDYFVPDDNRIRSDINKIIIANLISFASHLKSKDVVFSVCSFAYPHPDKMTKEQYALFDKNLRYWWRGKYISYKMYCHIVEIYNEQLKEMAKVQRLSYLPVAEIRLYPADMFFDICHMNDSGIRTKARDIAELIKPIITSNKPKLPHPVESRQLRIADQN